MKAPPPPRDRPMSRLIQIARPDAATMQPAPIEPAWIRGGAPVARYAQLACSHDGMATTAVWDCTEGSFDWHFLQEETVHILDGEVTVTEPGEPPRTLRPGDVAHFRHGAVIRWDVPRYVRKIAFCRQPPPRPLRIAHRLLNRARDLVAPRPSGGFGQG